MPPRSITCPKCGTTTSIAAATCPKCGTALKRGEGAINTLEDEGNIRTSPFEALPASTNRSRSEIPTGKQSAITPAEELPEDENASTSDNLEPAPARAKATNQALKKAPAEPRRADGAARTTDSGTSGEVARTEPVRIPSSAAIPRRTVTTGAAKAVAGPVPAANGGPTRRSAPHRAPAPITDVPTSSRKDPLIGVQLGEYVIEEKIGVGGMGVVYRAKQPLIGNSVAIKVLRSDVLSDKREIARLLDEAKVVNAVKHRGIINIFGAGELDDGRQYLVMEYLDGETLEKRLDREFRITTAEALPILDEVLAALAAAHGAGIVHRDLKPANVFLVKQNEGPAWVKLLDFGLARHQSTEVSRIAGTPDYISPEHARGRPAGPPADLYAFGILAFHLLTGQLPFKGNSPIEMMEQHVHTPPPVPSDIEKSIPKAMNGLILALLEKDPAKRPDATKAKKDLRAAATELRNRYTQPGAPQVEDDNAAMTSLSMSDLSPRLKELQSRGANEVRMRALGKHWPWALAGMGLLWVVGVVWWLSASPAPAAGTPKPIVIAKPPPKKLPEAPLNPVKVEPTPPEVVKQPDPAVKPTEPTVPVKPKEDPAVAVARWKLKVNGELDKIEARLDDKLSAYRPGLHTLQEKLKLIDSEGGEGPFELELAELKQKIDKAVESQ